MVNNYTKLPDGYKEIESIDLQKDHKIAGIVNGISLLIGVIMIFIGNTIVPILDFYIECSLLEWFMIILGIIVYIFLHEWVHGICMRYYSKQKPFYGFTGLYAYAGSHCYFNKKDYIVIALAPIVVWGIVLLIANIVFQYHYFWIIYFIQIMNVSGAAGDLYVSYRFSKLPEDILIKDIGVSMTIYTKERVQK